MYRSLIKDIWERGGKAYLVGGWVRDRLMGTPEECIKDIDIEVQGLEREDFEKILRRYGKYKKAGKAYEIYILDNKTEISYIEGDKPLKECARRRDLTVNSIYYDPCRDQYKDFYGGVEDIRKGILRSIDEDTFMDDPLRILRVAQFKCRLGFSVHPELKELVRNNSGRILEIPRERICLELEKIYLLGLKPSEGFRFLEETGVLEEIMPEITALKEILQDKVYHPEGDVYTHTLMMLDILEKDERSSEIFWSIIYHDAGKKETYPYFERHCEKSEEIFLKEIGKFTSEVKLIKTVRKLIRYHEEPLKMLFKGGPNRVSVKKIASKVDILQLLKLYRCDVLGRGRSDNHSELEMIEKIKKIYGEIKGQLKPIVRGKDLMEWGVNPGIVYSEILEELYEAQLEEKFQDLTGAKEYFDLFIKG